MSVLISSAQAGNLWIADRNFCTRAILCGLIEHGAHFLIREHGASPNPTEVSALKRIGRVETGMLYEQNVRPMRHALIHQWPARALRRDA